MFLCYIYMKVSVEDGKQQVEPYSELHIGSDEVLQIVVTSDQQHLYVLSTHKVPNLNILFFFIFIHGFVSMINACMLQSWKLLS